MEIERKWLVPSLSLDVRQSMKECICDKIEQGYFYVSRKACDARLRKSQNGKNIHCFVTVKSTELGLSRSEFECPLPKPIFDALWPLTGERRVQKKRYRIPYEGHTIELDVYEGKLKGLLVAEVEFELEKDAKAFVAPDWFGEDVTPDRRFKNRELALSQKIPEVGVKENSAIN
jgi:CYTH domain-containing protein